MEQTTPSDVLILTGMSGAGRSTAANALEDLDWYVVDNLPPQMLKPLLELTGIAASALPKVAAVVDVRGRDLFAGLPAEIGQLRSRRNVRIVFLDASDEVLVRRFEAVRRPHPLQDDGTIIDGIRIERERLSEIRERADVVIDTTSLNVHQLATRIFELFSEEGAARHMLTIMSFGFKYGIPTDADMVADMRFLPNPFWNEELRPFTGQDEHVREYVLGQPGAVDFVDAYAAALRPVLQGYQRENKRHAVVAVGCTGGKHRSVVIAEELRGHLRDRGCDVRIYHRDLSK